MAKKTIYLLRHGQTAYNRALVHQYHAVPLSPAGERQAELLAERITSFAPDMLIASDIKRAQQTAEAIARQTGLPLITEPLFEEIKRPTSLYGKAFADPRSIWAFIALYLHATNLHWHYSDEENFSEFRDRAHRAVEYLEQVDGERVVVVSHRIFIAGMLAAIQCRFACSMGSFVRKSVLLRGIANASITTLTYDSERADPWQIVSVSDARHLASMKAGETH
ncbi:MAG TPA: histidine phosphatase family protein [Candidatus Paceibacterota bacterium]|nr:histidine phosphatase family protein [Candidatus Paceibacterota bacterium]